MAEKFCRPRVVIFQTHRYRGKSQKCHVNTFFLHLHLAGRDLRGHVIS